MLLGAKNSVIDSGFEDSLDGFSTPYPLVECEVVWTAVFNVHLGERPFNATSRTVEKKSTEQIMLVNKRRKEVNSGEKLCLTYLDGLSVK